MLTAAQCRAARALIEWTRDQLSEASSIDVETIRLFELRFREPDEEIKRRIRLGLEEGGAVFISENGGGAGVRLKFSSAGVRAVRRWEGEGGLPGEDDI